MKDNKKVQIWLMIGALLIFIMVVIGGITRLTHSGLSISNYKLISGTLPPMGEQQWNDAFELYQQYPEYKKLNNHFSMQDFKDIYFWEWLHRFIGRMIGMVFIIPFVYFLIKKQLSIATIKKSIILLFLGGFQGALGWYMVKSGLVDKPDVSHYRLAAHLTTAFITFAYTLWVLLDILFPNKKEINKKFRNFIRIALILLIIQIIYGAFVAGLDAGFIHNYWPLMSDSKFMHETVLIEQNPIWKNFIAGKSGVQFAHRTLAYLVLTSILLIYFKSKKVTLTTYQRKGILALLLLVFLQFILGILTLVMHVPLILGVAHQVGAFFLLSAMTFTLHRFTK